MKKKLFILVCCGSILISGCATVDKTMASWMGHDVNELIARWGPPQQTMSDGKGGQIFVYAQSVQWTTPGQAVTNTTGQASAYGNQAYGSARSKTTYTPSQTHGYEKQRMFWVDRNGKIYRWAWRGL